MVRKQMQSSGEDVDVQRSEDADLQRRIDALEQELEALKAEAVELRRKAMPDGSAQRSKLELDSLFRRLDAVSAEAAMERARRRQLGRLGELRLLSARRGLRGLLGKVMRSVSKDELAARCRLLAHAGLFDRRFYRKEYAGSVGGKVEPVVDYLLRGGYEGRRPNALFDSAYYLDQNDDVRRNGDNPLLHYIMMGEAEGRQPNPSFDPIEYRDRHPDLPAWVSPLGDHLRRRSGQSHGPLKGVLSRLLWQWRADRLRRWRARYQRAVIRKAHGQVGIAFQPDVGIKGRSAPRAGRYELRSPGVGYTYVPPCPPADLDEQVAAMGAKPRFSIIVPLYNTPADLLDRLTASVEGQWYPHWELILVDDCSPRSEVREAVKALRNPKIVSIFLDENRGISGATNAGIARATGDFLVFLDHDDELTEDCLFELASCIERDDPDFIYSDEDKITADGGFADPFFKPDWSPDTLMSMMYTCHVSCVRRSLAEEVGPLQSKYDGSQDWDFILRVTEQAKKIAHIPKILYHWRIIPGSAAAEFDAKPQALVAAEALRLEALKRRGVDGTVESVAGVAAYSRVRYFVRGEPLVSLIIPSKNNETVLGTCIASVEQLTGYRNFEIVVVDNGSSKPETLAYLETLAAKDHARVVRHDMPFNFSELCNVGARASRGDILLFLNDDTEVISPEWLERMAGFAQLGHVGAVGAKLLYPDSRRVQHAGVVCIASGPSHAFLGADGQEPCYFSRNLMDCNWIAVTGACLMVERRKFEQIGGFDETFPVAYNDVDLCFRLLEAGYFNVVCPAAELLHYESFSRGIDHIDKAKMERLRADKHRLDMAHPQFFMRDPFFNPNLHPNDVNFTVPS
ncbi:glycosyltransferase [Aquabacter sp. CN5-332]|uniref:glycosyltransferase n=1 Tax=Aquabacter sp. CN5-332 TaxID=3156608 RepID=UPI0032B34B5C